MIYNKTAVLMFNVTGASAGLKHFFTCPGDFMVKKMWLNFGGNNAQATHSVSITNQANTETYATLTPGTTVLNTTQSVSVAEDDRHFTGNTVLALRNAVNDATANYQVFVLIAHQE